MKMENSNIFCEFGKNYLMFSDAFNYFWAHENFVFILSQFNHNKTSIDGNLLKNFDENPII